MDDLDVYRAVQPRMPIDNLLKPLGLSILLAGIYLITDLFPAAKWYIEPIPRLIFLLGIYIGTVLYILRGRFVNLVSINNTARTLQVTFIKGFSEFTVESSLDNFNYQIEDRLMPSTQTRYKVLYIYISGLQLNISELESSFSSSGLSALTEHLASIKKKQPRRRRLS